jgi:hypothetical protein
MGRVLVPFDRMRRQRNDVEYLTKAVPLLGANDVRDDLPRAAAMVDRCERMLDQMARF